MWDFLSPLLKNNIIKLSSDELDKLFLDDYSSAIKETYKMRKRDPLVIHASTLTKGCLRKGVYEAIDEKDYELDNNQIQYFITGEAVHVIYQKLSQTIDKTKYTVEKSINMDWIKAHIDLFNNELNMPIEMKTARMDSTQLQKYGGPSVTYLLQLAIYLILTKTNKGLLYYNLLAQKGGDFHHGYILNLSDDLKLKIEAFLKKLAEKYKNAIIQKNPYLIEGVHNDYNMNYICEYCPYANSSECVEGGIVRDKKIAWRKMKGSK